MLNANEIKMLNTAINTRMAGLQRGINSTDDEEIKAINQRRVQEFKNLQSKINTKGLFDETTISKQK